MSHMGYFFYKANRAVAIVVFISTLFSYGLDAPLHAVLPVSAAEVATSTGATSLTCPDITHTLALGVTDADVSGDVSDLQKFLARDAELYPEGKVTGVYDVPTEKAVQRWQTENGLVTSGTPQTTGFGLIGPKTLFFIEQGCRSEGSDADFSVTTESIASFVVRATVRFTLNGSSCSSYELDWGDGTERVTFEAGGASVCTQDIVEKSFVHDYLVRSEGYVITLRRGVGSLHTLTVRESKTIRFDTQMSLPIVISNPAVRTISGTSASTGKTDSQRTPSVNDPVYIGTMENVPECSVVASEKVVTPRTPVKVSWTSSGAVRALDPFGNEIRTSGSVTYTPTTPGTTDYIFKFYNSEGTVKTCDVAIAAYTISAEGFPTTDGDGNVGVNSPSVGPSSDGPGGIGSATVADGLGIAATVASVAIGGPIGLAIGLINAVVNPNSVARRLAKAIGLDVGGEDGDDSDSTGGDDTNAAPGSQATSGNTGISVGSDADAQENNAQGVSGPGPNTGTDGTAAGQGGPGPGPGPGTGPAGTENGPAATESGSNAANSDGPSGGGASSDAGTGAGESTGGSSDGTAY